MTPSGHEDPPDIDQRLRCLKVDIEAERTRLKERAPVNRPSALGEGMKGATEFVGAVIVGGAIGVGIDRFAGTRPLFTILLFLLGVAAGVVGLVRNVTPKAQK